MRIISDDGLEVDGILTDARLLPKKEMQAEPLDRQALQTLPPFDTGSEASQHASSGNEMLNIEELYG